MRPLIRLSAGLFALLVPLSSASAQLPAAPIPAGKPWGPSWVDGADDARRPMKLDADILRGRVYDGTDAPHKVKVAFWGDVASLEPGKKYALGYHYRLHTKKGEAGPVLGDAEHPKGVSFPLASAAADANWNGLEGAFVVDRAELTKMANWPTGRANATIFVRVEPRLYNATDKSPIGPARPSAIILAVDTDAAGKAASLLSLGDWLESHRRSPDLDARLAQLADLDAYNPVENGLGRTIGNVLLMPDVPGGVKAKFITFCPAELLGMKDNTSLLKSVEEMAKTADHPVLREAAERKMREFRP